MRVAIRKSTGQLIEAQGNDKAPMDALVANALAADIPADDVETKIVSSAEFEVLLAAAPQAPAQPSMADTVAALVTAVLDGDTTSLKSMTQGKAESAKNVAL